MGVHWDLVGVDLMEGSIPVMVGQRTAGLAAMNQGAEVLGWVEAVMGWMEVARMVAVLCVHAVFWVVGVHR